MEQIVKNEKNEQYEMQTGRLDKTFQRRITLC